MRELPRELSPTEYTYLNLQRIYSMNGQLVEHLPDTVEVIRCKDCRFYNDFYYHCEALYEDLGDDAIYVPVDEDDYCSRAERKGEQE